MFCTKCGHRNSDNSKFCVKCGTPLRTLDIKSTADKKATEKNISSLSQFEKIDQNHEPQKDNKMFYRDSIPNQPNTDNKLESQSDEVESKQKRRVAVTIIAAGIVLLIVIILLLNKNPKQIGTWYNTTEPDSDTLTITKDQSYIYGDIGGTWSESDNGIILIPNTEFDESEKMTFINYDGEFALEDESGIIWINDYEKACNIYEQNEAEKAEQQRQQQAAAEEEENRRKEFAYNTLEGSLDGRFNLEGYPDNDYIEFENGTYTYHCFYDGGEEQQYGTYELNEEVRDNYSGSDYYYSIEFIPENTSEELEEALNGESFIDSAVLEFEKESIGNGYSGKIIVEGSNNYFGEFDEEGFRVIGGPYIGENVLSDSELENL